MLTFTVTDIRPLGTESPIIADLVEPMTLDEVQSRIAKNQTPYKNPRFLRRGEMLIYESCPANSDQKRPLNIIFTNGAGVEITVQSQHSSEKRIERVGRGCVLAAEKPKYIRRNCVPYMQSEEVITVVKDRRSQFENVTVQMIRLDSNISILNLESSLELDLSSLPPAPQLESDIGPLTSSLESLPDFLQYIFDALKGLIKSQLVHILFTREANDTYTEFLTDDATRVLYIGLTEKARVFSYRIENSQLKKVYTLLGKDKKQIVIEDDNAEPGFRLEWQQPICTDDNDKRRLREFLHLWK